MALEDAAYLRDLFGVSMSNSFSTSKYLVRADLLISLCGFIKIRSSCDFVPFLHYKITNIMEITLYLNLTLTLDMKSP